MIEYIGLSGFARSGKDSAADYISLKYGHQKVSFSTPMKDALVRLNPLIRIVDPMDDNNVGGSTLAEAVDVFGWEDLKQVSPDVRGYIQRMGTEVGRQMFGNDVWVNRTFDEIDGERLVVFADVRFQNEAERVRKAGGQIWRVERDGVGAPYKHVSEFDLEGYRFDKILHNHGPLDDLYDQIDFLMGQSK
jgi:hypothetical protein